MKAVQKNIKYMLQTSSYSGNIRDLSETVVAEHEGDNSFYTENNMNAISAHEH